MVPLQKGRWWYRLTVIGFLSPEVPKITLSAENSHAFPPQVMRSYWMALCCLDRDDKQEEVLQLTKLAQLILRLLYTSLCAVTGF